MHTGDQFAVAHRRPLWAGNQAVIQRQLLNRNAKTLRRLLQQPATCLGGGIAQRHGRNLQRSAGDSRALIRCAFGIAQHHAYLLHTQVEFFGDDLPQRGAHTGAEINMAVEGIDLTVVANGNKQPLLFGFQARRLAFRHQARRRLDLIDNQQGAMTLQ
ncbi:hypothetical protein D3C80_1115590 [compost metagenome]